MRRPWWLAVGALHAIAVAVAAATGACNSAELSTSQPVGGSTPLVPDCNDDDSCDGGPSVTDGGKKKDAGPTTPTSDDVSIQVEPGDRGDVIKNAITGAQSSVHMTMYLLSNSTIINALIALHVAGKEVQVVLNKTFPSNGGDDTGNNDATYAKLSGAGVDVVWAAYTYTYTHAKTIVVDGTTAIISTMNVTYSSPTTNREYIATDTDPDDVADLEKIFAADLTGTPITLASKLTISPTNANTNGSPTAMLSGFMASATKSLDVEVQSLSDPTLVTAIMTSKKAGVNVRVIVADYEDSSSIAKLVAAGVAVKSLSSKTQLVVHAKAIVVDARTMWIGSQNFTTNALTNNREIGVFSSLPSEVAKVEATIDQDFGVAAPR